MMKQYFNPKIEVLEIVAMDVLTTSGPLIVDPNEIPGISVPLLARER